MSIVKPGKGMAFSQNPWENNLAASKNEGFFTGGFNTDSDSMVDPLVTGYGFIFWTKLPGWVTQEYANFANFTQKNFRSLGGIANLELAGISTNSGFTSNESIIAGLATKGQGFTLKHKEFSGSPVRNAYTHWLTGIRDPETGISRYPRDYKEHCNGGQYSAKYHTGELLYVQTRPDADNTDSNIIEYAHYFSGVMPLVVPRDHHNFEAGSSDQVELEISFAGKSHQSAAIDEFAVKKIKDQYKFITEGEYSSSKFK
jgi:hypothetical protein